jgi:hypothetical protein
MLGCSISLDEMSFLSCLSMPLEVMIAGLKGNLTGASRDSLSFACSQRRIFMSICIKAQSRAMSDDGTTVVNSVWSPHTVDRSENLFAWGNPPPGTPIVGWAVSPRLPLLSFSS